MLGKKYFGRLRPIIRPFAASGPDLEILSRIEKVFADFIKVLIQKFRKTKHSEVRKEENKWRILAEKMGISAKIGGFNFCVSLRGLDVST